MIKNRRLVLLVGFLPAFSLLTVPARVGAQDRTARLFAMDNLVAWCVVPFDARKRNPDQRAVMLKELGFTKLAYDWRGEHIPTFEQEIIQLKKQGIEFQKMVPYLFCLNLNGMTVKGPMILPIGKGQEDIRLIKMICDSDYHGPIGILDHRKDIDARQSLLENLTGLKSLVTALRSPTGPDPSRDRTKD